MFTRTDVKTAVATVAVSMAFNLAAGLIGWLVATFVVPRLPRLLERFEGASAAARSRLQVT